MKNKITKRHYSAWIAATALLLGQTAVTAAPFAAGPALAPPGNGLNAYWVRSEFTADNVQSALDILASQPGDGAFIESVSAIAPYVDYRDFEGGTEGLVDSPDLPDPFDQIDNGVPVTDTPFAVRFDGFLNVTETGSYNFRVHSDDGFRLTLGGEVIGIFDGNRSPDSSFSGPLDLESGLYAIELIGWEQSGQYVNELSWLTPGAADFTLVGTNDLFSAVPVPAALPLLASALGGLGWFRRRRRAA